MSGQPGGHALGVGLSAAWLLDTRRAPHSILLRGVWPNVLRSACASYMRVIRPALSRGAIVLWRPLTDSTSPYHACGCGGRQASAPRRVLSSPGIATLRLEPDRPYATASRTSMRCRSRWQPAQRIPPPRSPVDEKHASNSLSYDGIRSCASTIMTASSLTRNPCVSSPALDGDDGVESSATVVSVSMSGAHSDHIRHPHSQMATARKENTSPPPATEKHPPHNLTHRGVVTAIAPGRRSISVISVRRPVFKATTHSCFFKSLAATTPHRALQRCGCSTIVFINHPNSIRQVLGQPPRR